MSHPLTRVPDPVGKWGRVWATLITAVLAVSAARIEAASPDAIDYGRYRALVVGINDYAHLPKLVTAVNDASAMHDVLRNRYGFDSTLLLNPKRYDLIRALDRMRAELTENDNLLIYYAGHGFLDPQTDDGFWMPVDAEESSTANWIAVADVTRALKGMTAKHVLVIADSCYSGTLTRNVPIVVKTGSERLAELKRLNRKRARKAMTSGGLEPVMDGGGDGHSVFTRALLESLRDNDDVLDGYQLYAQLRRSVVVNAQQTPEYSDIRFAGDEGGEFLFVPVGLPAPIAATTAAGPGPARPAATTGPNQAAMDLAFWQSIQNSDRPADFEAYLRQFPDGTFAALARNRMTALQAPKAADPTPPAPQQQAALTPPTAQPPTPTPEPEAVAVDTLDDTYVTVKNANVRGEPDSKAEKLTTLPMGTGVDVTGKVKGRDWYRVALADGRTGYIYAPLLTEAGDGWRQAMVSGSGMRAVPGPGQRVFRIQPVIHDGRPLRVAVDILRAGLSGLPNSFVVAGGRGRAGPGDTVVSALISRLDVTRERNPEYTGAVVFRSLFGKLGQTITANVPEFFSIYRADVAVRAHDLASGTVISETANAEIKLETNFPTRDGIDLALQKALTEAVQRLTTQIGFQR